MASLSDLLTVKTAATYQAEILADVVDVSIVTTPLPVTAWQPGSVARTLIAVQAVIAADFDTAKRAIAEGGFLSTATGDWLTLLAEEVYDTTRDAAVATRGLVLLTDSGGGPYTKGASKVSVSNGAGRAYQSLEGITLPASGSLFVHVQAESAGANWNVSNSTITTLVSAMAGVTCDNPVPWITTIGTASVATVGTIKLTSTGGGAILVGGVTVSDGTLTYTNSEALTLAAGTPTDVEFTATAVGNAYNVGNDTITTVTVDPLGDISCNNPAPSSGTWIYTSGSDQQSDALLRTECQNRWAVLGVGWTEAAIDYLAKQAATSTPITRTKVVTNPGGVAGLVGVWVATAAGVPSGGDVAIVQAYFDADRTTLTSTIEVNAVTSLTVTITGTVKVPSAYLGTTQASVTDNLIQLEQSIPIGGSADASNAVQLEDILSAIKDAVYDSSGANTNPGSPVEITLTAPLGDTALTAYQVPDFDYSGLVFTGV